MSDDQANQTNPSTDSETASDSYAMRNESRLDTDGLHCSLGRVADITGSGMRLIVAPNDLPEIGDIQSYIFADAKDNVTVTGTVKWVRKGTAFTRRCEVGIEFVKLDPQTRDSIIRLAVHGKLGHAPDADIHVIFPNLYKILGVSQYASQDEIQTAYRKNAKLWHPDVSQAMNAPQRFEELQKAYAVLSDTTKRASYNTRFFNQDQQAA